MRGRVLITNDDGIDSPGLQALAKMAHRQGFEVVVAAPMVESSGSSAGIVATQSDGRVVVEKRSLPELAEVESYAVAATPAYIVLIASRGAFGEPFQLVLSGVNHGANFGYAIIHSGTVGAALTAVTYGCPAMAVSLDVGLNVRGDLHWTTAAHIASTMLDEALGAPPRVAINVNVPNVEREKVLGVKRARLAAFGAVQTNLEVGDGYVRTTIVDHSDEFEPGTDAALLADGYASVTPLQAVTEALEVL
ncbi:5'/3'-nucleotidase SurE [Rhizocola hellebori]|uniref:5'-nucleotidase n=1 Tax=Rhizocola hellebori TaxID=1392758 RepID=A0A8J3QAQ9_9ACTN|nr:5'/3'-nucleotidase SurE [Rhizocola hellebori]GIH06201.1 5'/3'-nucleotidase SurE [Rhizocola hellebori]